MNLKNTTNYIVRTESVNAYLSEINKIPVMTAIEERDIFASIEDAKRVIDENREKCDRNEISLAEFNKIKNHQDSIIEKSKQEIISRNQRFIFACAKRYDNNEILLDLVNVATLGMYEAIEKYDWRTGNRFCTIAVWFIRRAINAYLVKENMTVRTTNSVRVAPKVKKIENEFYLKNGRKPSAAEVIEILAETNPEIKIESELDLYGPHLEYIDALVGSDEEDATIADCSDFAVSTASTNNFETVSESDSISYAMNEALKSLTDRERKIFCMYAGYGYDKEYKDKEIAEIVGLTSERVRQIKHQAKAKMAKAYLAAQEGC